MRERERERELTQSGIYQCEGTGGPSSHTWLKDVKGKPVGMVTDGYQEMALMEWVDGDWLNSPMALMARVPAVWPSSREWMKTSFLFSPPANVSFNTDKKKQLSLVSMLIIYCLLTFPSFCWIFFIFITYKATGVILQGYFFLCFVLNVQPGPLFKLLRK